jgi:hypothetical protein
MRPGLRSLLAAEQQRPATDPIDLREPTALASPIRHSGQRGWQVWSTNGKARGQS